MIAQSALQQFQFEKIKFIVSPLPPHKDQVADYQIRLPIELRSELIQASIEGNQGFELDLRETERQGPSYTIDTVLDIKREYKITDRLPLILGADSFLSIESWKDHLSLMHEVCFLVAGREVLTESINLNDSFTASSLSELSWQPIEMPLLSISSTEIRRLKENNQAYRYLMTEKAFAEYERV